LKSEKFQNAESEASLFGVWKFAHFEFVSISDFGIRILPLPSMLDARLIPYVRSHFLDERTFVDGLGNVTGAAGTQRLFPVPLHGKGRNRNNRDTRSSRLFFQLSGNLKSVHSGELNVHYDQIRPFFFYHFKGRRCRRRLAHLVAVRAKQETREAPIHFVVLNQQNFLSIHKDSSRQGGKDA
jgi:hypothetical protein